MHTDSWGSGQPLTELSDEELRQETRERFTENPEAYRENYNPYLLQQSGDEMARSNT